MKKEWAAFLFLSLCMLGCSSVKTSFFNSLETTISKFNTAFAQGNLDQLQSMITKDYLHTNGSSSPITRTEWLNYLQQRKQQLQEGKLVVTKYELTEKEIRFYHKNTALVTGKVLSEGILDGKPFRSELRVTNLWTKEAGQWKRAAFHDTRIE